MIRFLSAFAALLLSASPSLAVVVSLPANFSSVQGTHGFSYESIGDSRASNVQHPGTGVTPMGYRGEFSFGYPGDLPHPTFAHAELFPYVQHRPDFGGMTIQPGTSGFDFGGGTANIGVAVRWEAPAAGLYRIDGLFAPNNQNWTFGNGVDVLIARGLDLENPLFAATISDAHAVNLLNPFGGTGATPFDLQVSLAAGESVRFIVFADGQGQDGTYDTSAFQVTIAEVPEPSSIALGAFALAGLIAFQRGRRCVSF